jgi:hypothetical protein
VLGASAIASSLGNWQLHKFWGLNDANVELIHVLSFGLVILIFTTIVHEMNIRADTVNFSAKLAHLLHNISEVEDDIDIMDRFIERGKNEGYNYFNPSEENSPVDWHEFASEFKSFQSQNMHYRTIKLNQGPYEFRDILDRKKENLYILNNYLKASNFQLNWLNGLTPTIVGLLAIGCLVVRVTRIGIG